MTKTLTLTDTAISRIVVALEMAHESATETANKDRKLATKILRSGDFEMAKDVLEIAEISKKECDSILLTLQAVKSAC